MQQENWWEEAPLVQQAPQRGDGDDWWKSAPVVSTQQGTAPSSQGAVEQELGDYDPMSGEYVPDDGIPMNPDLTASMAQPYGDGSSRENAIDLSGNLYADQIGALRQGAWVRTAAGEEYQLPGDAFFENPRGSDEQQSGALFVRRPNLQDQLGGATTAFVEQVPGGDEALAAITGALNGQGYEAARESQMLNRELLNQTNRGSRIAGGVAGAVLPSLALPGAGWVNGAQGVSMVGRAATLGAGYGGVYGFGNTDGDLRARMTGAGVGAGMGFVAGGGLQGVGNLMTRSGAKAAANPSPQRALADAGVELTPGQMLGGGWQRLEDGMTSVPVVGDAIRSAQRRSMESFNRAAYDWALDPIGARLPKGTDMGRAGYRTADDMAGAAYDSALSGVTVDPAGGFNQAVATVRGLPSIQGEAAAVLANTVDDIERRFSGPLTGEAYKQLETEVKAAIRAAAAGSENNPALRPVVERLGMIKDGLQDAFNAADPIAGVDKAAADAAYARLVRIGDAAQRPGTAARDGIFTASDLNAAVRKADNTARNRSYARGEALGQDLSDAGQAALPQSVPDSGTPYRSLLHMLGGLGIGTTASAVGVPLASAATAGVAGAAGLGAGIYSRPVLSMINRAYRGHAPGSGRLMTGGLLEGAAPRSAALEQGVLQWLLNHSRDDQALAPAR